MKATKFHKQFGEVKVLSSDANTTTIVIVATGEEKKMLNKFTNLTDAPIEVFKSVKAKSVKREITKEEENHLSSIESKLAWLDRKSTENYRSGKYGACKFL